MSPGNQCSGVEGSHVQPTCRVAGGYPTPADIRHATRGGSSVLQAVHQMPPGASSSSRQQQATCEVGKCCRLFTRCLQGQAAAGHMRGQEV